MSLRQSSKNAISVNQLGTAGKTNTGALLKAYSSTGRSAGVKKQFKSSTVQRRAQQFLKQDARCACRGTNFHLFFKGREQTHAF
jgi:hypothetical protein